MNKDDLKKDSRNTYLIDESDENTDNVKHPKESHVTPTQSEEVIASSEIAGYESPYLKHPENSDNPEVQDDQHSSLNLADLKTENITQTADFRSANPSLSTAPVAPSAPQTIPLSEPHTIPEPPKSTPQQPEVIPVQPASKIEYVQVAKVKKGGGILGYLFLKLFNCVGCLLLIISLIIVGFTVWIINF